MQTYDKIETIYVRDTEGTKKLIDGLYRNPTVNYLRDCQWIWTEKVDGTNTRVHWDGHTIEFGGRTDKAQIQPKLQEYLNDTFKNTATEELFEQLFGEKDVMFFGEGYGASIQNGGAYMPDGKSVGFILFDIMINGMYLEREDVEDIARSFGLPIVPIVGIGALTAAVDYVKQHQMSVVAEGRKEMEGIVARPERTLFDRKGERILVKIKWEDMKEIL